MNRKLSWTQRSLMFSNILNQKKKKETGNQLSAVQALSSKCPSPSRPWISVVLLCPLFQMNVLLESIWNWLGGWAGYVAGFMACAARLQLRSMGSVASVNRSLLQTQSTVVRNWIHINIHVQDLTLSTETYFLQYTVTMKIFKRGALVLNLPEMTCTV